MLYLLEGMAPFQNLQPQIRNLRAKTESISKQLGAWTRSLRESSLKGERYVSGKTRRADQAARERQEFLRKLEQIRRGGSS